MKQIIKKALLTVAIAAAAIGALWGGLVLYRNTQKKPVKVYSVNDFAMTNYWGDSSETYGMVTTERLQQVFVSDSQQVTEVFVTEGQEIKIGDPLLAFDTTLTDIDLEKAQTDLSRMELQLEQAKTDLETLKRARPFTQVLITPPSTGVSYVPQSTPQLISGGGTKNNPYYWLWGSSDTLTFSRLEKMFDAVPDTSGGEGEEGEETEAYNADVIYVAFVTRKSNALNGPVLSSWGLKLDRSSGSLHFSYYAPVLSEEILAAEEDAEPYYQTYGTYSAAELAKMRSEKEQEIKELELKIKMAKVDLARLQEEQSDGMVYSTVDGIVKTLRDPDEAYITGQAVLEVSGGGGFYIQVTLSELQLDKVSVGDPVTVMSWMSGMSYEGSITEINLYPAENQGYGGDGNTNVSWYPFTVFVDENAALTQNEYVSVTYSSNDDASDTWYLENQFIRTENGKSFVLVKGENGLLEKRIIQTGKGLWSSYTQIRGGLTLDDRVAFPYGKDVGAGAKTQDATAEELYSSY